MTHTRGPWKYVWFGGPQIGGGEDHATAVCTLWGGFRHGTETPEEIANRDLIAAAPDLLEAAQEAASVLSNMGFAARDPALVKLRAAILKAKGEA